MSAQHFTFPPQTADKHRAQSTTVQSPSNVHSVVLCASNSSAQLTHSASQMRVGHPTTNSTPWPSPRSTQHSKGSEKMTSTDSQIMLQVENRVYEAETEAEAFTRALLYGDDSEAKQARDSQLAEAPFQIARKFIRQSFNGSMVRYLHSTQWLACQVILSVWPWTRSESFTPTSYLALSFPIWRIPRTGDRPQPSIVF